jgi:glycosyltransferase involved in cell wall biosynthesis
VGVAGRNILIKKLPVLGFFVANYFESVERKLFAKSDHIIAIAEGFLPHIHTDHSKVSVIGNWAALKELPPKDRKNEWGAKHGLHDTKNVIYSGTLGLKHNPELLVQLALATREDPEVRVVVCSGARGFKYIQERKEELGGLPNLVLLPFQEFADVPLVFGTADLVVALLEPDAGIFSVPSKVLAYLCAKRPILMAVPLENLSAEIVQGSGAGVVVAPSDTQAFVAEAQRLLKDESLGKEMGEKGRAYAEATFNLTMIGDKFQGIFESLVRQKG